MSATPLPRWVCRDCGYDGLRFGVTHSPVDVSVAIGCPACGGELFRDDPLGQIEQEASRG